VFDYLASVNDVRRCCRFHIYSISTFVPEFFSPAVLVGYSGCLLSVAIKCGFSITEELITGTCCKFMYDRPKFLCLARVEADLDLVNNDRLFYLKWCPIGRLEKNHFTWIGQ
jgi:hypothetical protein